LIFDRKINRRTPGRFRTRVITDQLSILQAEFSLTQVLDQPVAGTT
jgi:hypothetical protein